MCPVKAVDGTGAGARLRLVTREVRLTPVDEHNLEPLLSVAVAEAEPGEVMPPVEGPPGWTALRRDAFRDFHRAHFGGLDGPNRTVMFAIIVGGDVVGMVRMGRRAEPHTMETGLWLGRSARGQGIGLAALRALLAEAGCTGARFVVAETTPGNAAAIAVLGECGARLRPEDGAVHAEIPLDR